ncbi:ROK family transcriptional regulator [Novosphingobium sp. JCM 18896]|uniref:ROK family transcriptional regulator n=1 Tax=Novosphingobium sp. JCM 18896 TaxID=2989731 RepID=UPI0022225E07|nr:ROK family transcriptional regulator [Novosphingobium sp. JCM 18896]MCW1429494.1 ROK family transcriptional regulator [Novosphingobium sp. JCM 18896]
MSDQAFNRLSVLKKLRAAEPISRTDLAQISGLNGGTITAIIRDLVERGLVIEERLGSATRGRPKLNLRINPEGAFVVGATMSENGQLCAEIVDLRGQSVSSHSAPAPPTRSLEDLAQAFCRTIAEAIAASPIPRTAISQVGIGLPAIVVSQTGMVELFETFEGAPFAFAEAIERELRIPTRIDNNNNILARSEHWFGDGGVDDFTLVVFDLGLGGTRYQAGQLLIGSHGIEAEFGHTKIVPEGGRPCHCGGRGCLQAYSSVSAIVYQACELRGEPQPAIDQLRSRFGEVVEAVQAGDPDMAELFARAGRLLGRGLANHVNMQDPERIVVLAKSRDLIDLVSPPFFAALHEDTLPVLRDGDRVTFKQMDDSAYARGAAAMVLEQLYQFR